MEIQFVTHIKFRFLPFVYYKWRNTASPIEYCKKKFNLDLSPNICATGKFLGKQTVLTQSCFSSWQNIGTCYSYWICTSFGKNYQTRGSQCPSVSLAKEMCVAYAVSEYVAKPVATIYRMHQHSSSVPWYSKLSFCPYKRPQPSFSNT